MTGSLRHRKTGEKHPDIQQIAVLEEQDIPPLTEEEYAALEAISKKVMAEDEYVLIDGPAW